MINNRNYFYWIISSVFVLGSGIVFAQDNVFPSFSITNEDIKQSKIFTLQDGKNNVDDIEDASRLILELDSDIDDRKDLKLLKEDGVLPYRKGFFGFGSRNKQVKSHGALIALDVERENAVWLRFKFTDEMVNSIGSVKIISNDANSVQEYTPELLKSWGNVSSIVPAKKARVLLTLQPDSILKPAEISVDDFLSGIEVGNVEDIRSQMISSEENDFEETEHLAATEEGVCEPDERLIDLVPTYGRSTKFCTVFRLEKNIFASAGHCFRPKKDVDGNLKRESQSVIFNVPESSELGIPQFPSPIEEFSFPVIMDSIKCDDCSFGTNKPHGEDWALFILGRSPTKTTLLPEQKLPFPNHIVEYDLLSGSHDKTIAIMGFGLDSEPQTSSLALQRSRSQNYTITLKSSKNVTLAHFADTQSGNSGSPIFQTGDSEKLLAIHTGGKCNPEANKPNFGTAFSNPELQKSLNVLRTEIRQGKYDSILKPN